MSQPSAEVRFPSAMSRNCFQNDGMGDSRHSVGCKSLALSNAAMRPLQTVNGRVNEDRTGNGSLYAVDYWMSHPFAILALLQILRMFRVLA